MTIRRKLTQTQIPLHHAKEQRWPFPSVILKECCEKEDRTGQKKGFEYIGTLFLLITSRY